MWRIIALIMIMTEAFDWNVKYHVLTMQSHCHSENGRKKEWKKILRFFFVIQLTEDKDVYFALQSFHFIDDKHCVILCLSAKLNEPHRKRVCSNIQHSYTLTK